MATFNDIATDAYIKNGILAPGESLDANLAEYAMREANRLLDQWNIQDLYVFTTKILLFSLTARPISTSDSATQYWYTIGPAGGTLTTDFQVPQPNRIKRANLMLQSSNPNARVPLAVLDALQWSDQTVPNLGTTIPTSVYYDYANVPNGVDGDGIPVQFSRLYVWPYPTVTQNQLELFVWNQVARFTDIQDTFSLPQGYEDALMLTLAERTSEGVRAISPTLRADAARARANIRSLNSQSPKMSTTDSGMPGRGAGNSTSSNVFNGWQPSQNGGR